MTHYNLIIIGTGARGNTLAYKLAPPGQKHLVLGSGNYIMNPNTQKKNQYENQ